MIVFTKFLIIDCDHFYFGMVRVWALRHSLYDIQYNDIQYNDIQYNDIQYNDIQYNDIQYNDIQHNDTQQKGLIFDTHYAECHILFIVSVVMLSVVVPILGPYVEK